MMKKVFWLLVWFILAGCTPQLAETPTVENVTLVAAATTAPPIPSSPFPTTTLSTTRPTLPPEPTVPAQIQITPSSFLTATPDHTCPPVGSPPPFSEPETIAEWEDAVLTYVNAGGQWQSFMASPNSIPRYDIVTVDLNGDGVNEVVLLKDFTTSEDGIWVFQCQSAQYELILGQVWGSHFFFDNTLIQDLTSDGYDDILIIATLEFSSDCALVLGVISWNIVEIQIDYPRLTVGDLPSDVIGCRAEITLEDDDNNSIPEIVISGTTIFAENDNSVRHIKIRYEWRNGAFRLQEMSVLP